MTISEVRHRPFSSYLPPSIIAKTEIPAATDAIGQVRDTFSRQDQIVIGAVVIAILGLSCYKLFSERKNDLQKAVIPITPPETKAQIIEVRSKVKESDEDEFFSFPSSSSNGKSLDLENNSQFQEMRRNAILALLEHCQSLKKGSFASSVPSIHYPKKDSKPLSLHYCQHAEQGARPTMEDAHFYLETKNGAVLGIFDGHIGGSVSRFAAEKIESSFFRYLEDHNGNVYETMIDLLKDVESEIEASPILSKFGSTVVLCYVDKINRWIYTATLGDSEAVICRKNLEGRYELLPLSRVCNWASEEDARRAANYFRNPKLVDYLVHSCNPKSERMPFATDGRYSSLNVSRALGDCFAKPAISSEPKLSMHQIEDGDILILGCDGLFDFVSGEEIIAKIHSCQRGSSLARELVEHALTHGQSSDNVTVQVAELASNAIPAK